MTVIGITGGTGAGKTTALDTVREMGGVIIDCDAVYHGLTANSTDMLREIDECFPGVVSGGVLQRRELGTIVFADESALLKLNSITHRYVKDEVNRTIKAHQASGGELAAIDAIALFESGLNEMCSFTVFITAPKELRARRIMVREGISYDYAMLRIGAQKDDRYFESKCTYTLVNDFDTADEFKKLCRKFFSEKVRCEHEQK